MQEMSGSLWWVERWRRTAAAVSASAPIGRFPSPGSWEGSGICTPYEVKYTKKAQRTGIDWNGPRHFWCSKFSINPCITQLGTDFVIVRFLTTRELDGSRPKVFPYERPLFTCKQSRDVSCSYFLGIQHTLVVLAGEEFNDRCKSFRANLTPKDPKVSVSLQGWVWECEYLMRQGKIVTGITAASSVCSWYWSGE